ncbi:unnamed protein product, partial [Didymodactylos carnosus]
DEQQMYHESGKFVRFLNTWNSSLPSLFQRIKQLATDIVHNGYWNMLEIDLINAWLNDLNRIGYSAPNIISYPKHNQEPKKVRAAVCVTGLMECAAEGWGVTDPVIRKHLTANID